jgi:hypothetical protein
MIKRKFLVGTSGSVAVTVVVIRWEAHLLPALIRRGNMVIAWDRERDLSFPVPILAVGHKFLIF